MQTESWCGDGGSSGLLRERRGLRVSRSGDRGIDGMGLEKFSDREFPVSSLEPSNRFTAELAEGGEMDQCKPIRGEVIAARLACSANVAISG
jgi:hypothetical protein